MEVERGTSENTARSLEFGPLVPRIRSLNLDFGPLVPWIRSLNRG